MRAALTLLGCALAPFALAQPAVECRYTYGGETHSLWATPTTSPYTVANIAIGSYFQFRVVFQTQPADLASIKVYTFADRDDGPALIHQTSYPYPIQPLAGKHPFTGQQRVYEPLRDGELEYACWLHPQSKSKS